MAERLRFEPRYEGFPGAALGGYVAGAAARGLSGPVEANLRSLPPLEKDLELREADGGVGLWDGETLVVEAAPAEFELDVPAPVDPEAARAGSDQPALEPERGLWLDMPGLGLGDTPTS